MKNSVKFIIAFIIALGIIIIAIAIGNVKLNIHDALAMTIFFEIRLPRVLLAFLAGGAISVSGAVVQSLLKNPLASPYTIGISSGVALGAGIIIISGVAIPIIGAFTLPLTGFVSGLITVSVVLLFAATIDKSFSDNTVILFGMVVSLFTNAILTVLAAFFSDSLKRISLWQMGSFALRGWDYVKLFLPFLIVGLIGTFRFVREMDMLTGGDEYALSAGVEAGTVKKLLFLFTAVLTGGAVALSGVIGFVDLISPHIARRIVGSKHIFVLPMSFLVGGIIMVLSDLVARTVVAPSELPVGAVTAIIGAPFFAYIYFGGRKKC
jgi:iron complex transport system permease protein